MTDTATSATGSAPAVSRTWYLSFVIVGSAIFLLYSGAFLYFFVDDEAIPLVYAVNLARGRGLVYTVLEGRVEGYSDFLRVLWTWALFEAASIAHWHDARIVSIAPTAQRAWRRGAYSNRGFAVRGFAGESAAGPEGPALHPWERAPGPEGPGLHPSRRGSSAKKL